MTETFGRTRMGVKVVTHRTISEQRTASLARAERPKTRAHCGNLSRGLTWLSGAAARKPRRREPSWQNLPLNGELGTSGPNVANNSLMRRA
jgi:hypothetical protein